MFGHSDKHQNIYPFSESQMSCIISVFLLLQSFVSGLCFLFFFAGQQALGIVIDMDLNTVAEQCD